MTFTGFPLVEVLRVAPVQTIDDHIALTLVDWRQWLSTPGRLDIPGEELTEVVQKNIRDLVVSQGWWKIGELA